MGTSARLLRHIDRAPELYAAFRASSQWWQLAMQHARVRKGEFPQEIRFRSGDVLRVEDQTELSVLWNIFASRCYRVDPRDRVIVDAGANIGMFAVYAARRAPAARIVSLEPFPGTFARLTQHLARNGLEDRVEALALALAASDGERGMSGMSGTSPNRKLILDESYGTASVVVRTSTLSSLLDHIEVESVDLLKMDIEGAEHETLAATPAATLRRIRRIDVEVHQVKAELGFTPERLFAHLGGAGHRLRSWEPDTEGTGIARFELFEDAATTT